MIYSMRGDEYHAGPVMLSDTYSSSVGAAKDGIGASQKALYDAYNLLNNNKANVSTVVSEITRDGNTFTAKNNSGTQLFTFTQKDDNTTYSAGTGLSLSGTTFSLPNSGVTAGTYGPSADVSGANGNTISVPQITVDAQGRITSVTNRTYTSVNTDTNTTYTAASDGGLSLSSNAFSIKNSGVTAGTYGPSGNVTGSNTIQVNIPQITVNAKGQVTSVTNRVYTSVDSNTVYTHPTTAGNKHIPAGGSSGQILRWSAAGTAAWGADNNTNTGSYMSCGTVSATVSSLAATSNTSVTSAAITPPSGYSILTVVPRASSHAGVLIYSCTLSSSKVTFGVRNTSTAAQSNITVTATVFYYKSW